MKPKHIIKNPLVIFFMALLVFTGCKKEDVSDGPTRLFRPVLKEDLLSEGNWIKASWQKIKDASSYTVQLSRDTFRTIDLTMTIDSNTVVIENLKWNQLYQVQVKAIAPDTTQSSKMSFLGTVKTPKFPTIMNTPGINDLTDEAVRVSWTNSGATVTSIKILKASDSTLVKEATLNSTDVNNQYKVVAGLASSTEYIVFLYSGTTVRGWDNFTTKASLTGTIVDLRSIANRPSVLDDTLASIASGSTVILKRGMTYDIVNNNALSKTVTFTSGDDLAITEPATIFLKASNFDIVAGSIIDAITFNNVRLTSDDATLSSKYVFNIGTACTVGKIVFESCKAEAFRGFIRTKEANTINEVSINNSVINDIGNYGVVIVDHASAKIENINVTNSTIYRIGASIIRNVRNSFTNSVKVENCTINEAPFYNTWLVDFNTFNAASGITIRNCIFGVGKASGALSSVRGARAGTATNITGAGNYGTSDYVVTANPIPGVTAYTKSSIELWQNPTGGDFKIKETSFPGRSTAGDPRWQ